jgi:hypothetical protein
MAPKKSNAKAKPKTAQAKAPAKVAPANKLASKASKAAQTFTKPAAKVIAKPVVVAPKAAAQSKKQGKDIIEYLREYALENPAMAVVGLVAILLVMLLIVG